MSNFKTERIKDKKHLEFVATQLPCIITGSDHGIQAHHLLRDDMQRISRGTGMRAQDNFVVPMRHDKHTDLHMNGNEVQYLISQGVWFAVELALILYDHTGDTEFCTRVLRAWKS